MKVERNEWEFLLTSSRTRRRRNVMKWTWGGSGRRRRGRSWRRMSKWTVTDSFLTADEVVLLLLMIVVLTAPFPGTWFTWSWWGWWRGSNGIFVQIKLEKAVWRTSLATFSTFTASIITVMIVVFPLNHVTWVTFTSVWWTHFYGSCFPSSDNFSFQVLFFKFFLSSISCVQLLGRLDWNLIYLNSGSCCKRQKIVDEHVSRVWKKKRVNWNEGRIHSLSKSNFYDFSVSNEPSSRTEREMLLLSDPSSNTCLFLSHFILFFSFQTPLKCSNGGKMGRGWERGGVGKKEWCCNSTNACLVRFCAFGSSRVRWASHHSLLLKLEEKLSS